MRYLKWIGLGFLAIIIIVAVLALTSWLRFGPLAVFGHKPITITLPFSAEHESKSMLPLGEKEDVHPDGHPGIDFQWEYAAPLIATSDAKITSVAKAKDGNNEVIYIVLQSGEYTSSYKELDPTTVAVKKGDAVKQGDLIGYPHGTYFADSGGHTNYQLHWEFGYSSFPGSTRICPVNYFDSSSKARIDTLWARVKPTHNNPTGQEI